MFTRTFINAILALISTTAMMLANVPSSAAHHALPSTGHSIQEQSQRNRALKFDEYGAVGECDEKARLDNFAIQLLNEPESKGYIIGYDGRNDLPARLGFRHLRAQDYVVASRGIDPDRLVALKGGYREEAATELWIAPKDAPAPEPSNTVVVKKETGKTFKYNEFHPEGAVVEYQEYEYPEEDAVNTGSASEEPQQEIMPVQNLPAEQTVQSQEVPVDNNYESENYDILWASESYARALDEERGLACIIYYAQRDGGHLFKLQQIIDGGQNLLVKKYNIKEDRIKTIFGGYRDYTTIDLWIVPPGDSLPMPTPEYEQNATASVKEAQE